MIGIRGACVARRRQVAHCPIFDRLLTVPPVALSVSPQSGPTCERTRGIHTFESGQGMAGLSRRESTMPAGAARRGCRTLRTTAVAAALAAIACGCGDGGSRAYGEAVDESSAIPLKELMADLPANREEPITVSGTIGTVCRSDGCWFTLRDLTGEEPVEIFVDLRGGAEFTVAAGIEGKRAILAGRLVGERPDLAIRAVGLVVK